MFLEIVGKSLQTFTKSNYKCLWQNNPIYLWRLRCVFICFTVMSKLSCEISSLLKKRFQRRRNQSHLNMLCFMYLFIFRVIKVFNHLRVMQFKKNLHNLTDKNCNRKTVEHEINLFVNAQHLNNTFIIYYVVDSFFELPQSQCSGTTQPGVFKQKCNFTVSVSSFKVFMTLIDHEHNLSGHRFHLTLKKILLSHSYAAITTKKISINLYTDYQVFVCNDRPYVGTHWQCAFIFT